VDDNRAVEKLRSNSWSDKLEERERKKRTRRTRMRRHKRD